MKIIIYTKRGCPWCTGVLNFLNEKGYAYEEREVLTNPQYFEEMKIKSGQTKAPTLDIDGHILADSDAPTVEKYLASLK